MVGGGWRRWSAERHEGGGGGRRGRRRRLLKTLLNPPPFPPFLLRLPVKHTDPDVVNFSTRTDDHEIFCCPLRRGDRVSSFMLIIIRLLPAERF